MIRDGEIRRLARTEGVEPRIMELDYVLGWALWAVARHPDRSEHLVFKGGTCLRKCYFPEYRFSEDLDFTAIRWAGWEELERPVREAFQAAGAASGIDFGAQPLRMRVVEEEYGRETLRFIIYWRGPHASGGSPPGLRPDITRDEVVAFDPVPRAVNHGFSDAGELGLVEVECYALEEVMAEKLRAVLGQRIYAVSRDLYDIFFLQGHVDERNVVRGLPRKLAARDVGKAGPDPERLIVRKEEFRADWERNLLHLLPPGAEREFEEVWDQVISQVTRVTDGLGRGRGQ